MRIRWIIPLHATRAPDETDRVEGLDINRLLRDEDPYVYVFDL